MQDKTDAREHVVLCGLGELGLQTLQELRRLGDDVVAVAHEPNPEQAERARELGATVIEGSHRQKEVLCAPGIETAAALVATDDDDIGNLHAALVAHELNPRRWHSLGRFLPALGVTVWLLLALTWLTSAATSSS